MAANLKGSIGGFAGGCFTALAAIAGAVGGLFVVYLLATLLTGC